MASPCVTVGQGPARTKSSQVVGIATNVFVSCMNPPTAMRMAYGSGHGRGGARIVS